MPRPTITLADFDPQIITTYQIDNSDLNNIFRYLQAMQSHLEEGTWDDLFETSLPFFEPCEEEITEAESILKQLRQTSMRHF